MSSKVWILGSTEAETKDLHDTAMQSGTKSATICSCKMRSAKSCEGENAEATRCKLKMHRKFDAFTASLAASKEAKSGVPAKPWAIYTPGV